MILSAVTPPCASRTPETMVSEPTMTASWDTACPPRETMVVGFVRIAMGAFLGRPAGLFGAKKINPIDMATIVPPIMMPRAPEEWWVIDAIIKDDYERPANQTIGAVIKYYAKSSRFFRSKYSLYKHVF